MPLAVGVSFKPVSRYYWFASGDLALKVWDRVIVETNRGIDIGTVRTTTREIPDEDVAVPLKPVIRLVTMQDMEVDKQNRDAASMALGVCAEKVAKHGLPMKLVRAEYTFDRSQLTFYFLADNRVDFRELVRDLASTFRTRIQLLQIGPRDQTKMMGGIGLCGVELCCARFLLDFAPISMKMAKDQNLNLNPAKFSGVCGKLLCCLRYEHETYCELRRELPTEGTRVQTPDGEGVATDVDILRALIGIQFLDGVVRLYPAHECRWERDASAAIQEEPLPHAEEEDTHADL